ncbi:hypothetical protein PSTG_04934 [Puccinia striiformis f. sp. tritici PST-78]|uniref:Uncharacterized protein n=1 Tax=Puccinia striiformis f. sp. tritici PST-78 TaxID=1165861 RepID=A0A0L0VS24_9BASI|nr:hypothetical protein PSTG_04934 [Puccinia striiformis f. sp. tritici PST-78]
MSSHSTALVVGPSKRQIPTPPNTSRSSFSELPLSQSTARPMPKRLEQAAQKAGSEGSGEMEDDDEEQGDDDDDDDEEEAGDYDMEDSFSQSGMAAPSAYARLDGASAEEAFTPEDDLFAVVEADAAREAEAAMHDLTGSISAALNQYRTQFDTWEKLDQPPASAVRASILLDQGLARFIYALEPLRHTANQITDLSRRLIEFGAFLTKTNFDPRNLAAHSQLWNGLSRLSDEIVQVEDGLRSGTTQVEELNGWVDGLLTPALAEVKFETSGPNRVVSQILDVHSYLCESLGKVTTILGIYRSALSHIGRAIDSLLNSLIEPNNILNHINFPIDQTATWAVDAAASLQSTSRSITILCSISSSIQAHTQGGTAALSHPSNPVKHPSTRFCHAISY